MKLVILAAGKGTRLMPLTKNTPKSLLDVGEGFTLIEMQLARVMKSGGIDEVIIVVGYCAEQIEAKLKNFKDIPIRFVHNIFYDETNNLISLWFAMPYINDNFIMLSGDYIFKPELLRSLLDVDESKEIVTAIHKKESSAFDDDEVKAILRGEKIIQVGKKISHHSAHAHALSMIRFMNGGRKILAKKLNTLVHDEKNKDTFYLTAMQGIMDDGFPVHCLECKSTDWAEVDHLFDLKTAQSALKGKLRGLLREQGIESTASHDRNISLLPPLLGDRKIVSKILRKAKDFF